MVATPIGNLADMTFRALHTLSICDVIACEDTRVSKHLLAHYGIVKPNRSFIALHQHNESDQAPLIISLLSSGQRVAMISDAGTPGISDPGSFLVHSVSSAGFRVIPIPGVSSLSALLSVSGISLQSTFRFQGFLSSKTMERAEQIKLIQSNPEACVLFEAPHRILALCAALMPLGKRLVTVGRELTKQFEQIHTTSADALSPWIEGDTNRVRGEFVLVVHPNLNNPNDPSRVQLYSDLLKLLLSELSVKGSVKMAQLLTNAPKNDLYELALQLSKE